MNPTNARHTFADSSPLKTFHRRVLHCCLAARARARARARRVLRDTGIITEHRKNVQTYKAYKEREKEKVWYEQIRRST